MSTSFDVIIFNIDFRYLIIFPSTLTFQNENNWEKSYIEKHYVVLFLLDGSKNSKTNQYVPSDDENEPNFSITNGYSEIIRMNTLI